MKRLTRTRRRAGIVLAVYALLTLLACLQIDRLQFDVSAEGFRLEGDPGVTRSGSAETLPGADRSVVILLSDPELFSSDNLQAIRKVHDRLSRMDSVVEVKSLFTTPHPKVEGDFVQTAPYLTDAHLSASDIKTLISEANANPFLSGSLISKDGATMAFHLLLSGTSQERSDRYHDIEGIIAPLRSRLQEVRQLNPGMIDHELQDQIQSDIRTVAPVALGVLFLVMLFCCRNASLAILPLLTSGISIVWLFGLMPYLGFSVNVLSSLVPALLVIIGSTEDIHLIAEYRSARLSKQSGSEAISTMWRRMRLITAITAITSLIGVASLFANPLQLMREFSLVASLGLALNYLITVSFIPAYLRWLSPSAIATPDSANGRLSESGCRRYYDFLWRNRWLLILGTLAIPCVALICSPALRVDNNLADFIPSDSPTLQALTSVEQKLSGTSLVRIVIDTPQDNAFKHPEALKQIAKLQNHLDETGVFNSNQSLADLISLAYSLVNDSGLPEMPEDQAMIEELLLFIDASNLANFVNADFSESVVFVRVGLLSSENLSREFAKLERFVQTELDSRLHVTITGDSVASSQAVDRMVSGQFQSLVVTLALVFAIGASLVGDVKGGIIAMTVNAMPLCILFVTLGLANLRFNYSTAMVATIAYGISVDYTLHFMQRFRQQLKLTDSRREAMIRTIQNESLAIVTTTLTLTAGMSCFLLSSFPSAAIFGLLCVEVLFAAFLCNFTLAPLLLMMFGVGSRGRVRQCPVSRDIAVTGQPRQPSPGGYRRARMRTRNLRTTPSRKSFFCSSRSEDRAVRDYGRP